MNSSYINGFFDELQKLGALGWVGPSTVPRPTPMSEVLPIHLRGPNPRFREADEFVRNLVARRKGKELATARKAMTNVIRAPFPAAVELTRSGLTAASGSGLLRRAATRILTKGRAG